MAYTRRRLLERRLKEMLLGQARRAGVEPGVVAEWLYEEHGVKTRPNWVSVERALLGGEVTAQEFAAFLLDIGVEVDEEEWLEVLKSTGVSPHVPRLPGAGGGAREPRGDAQEEARGKEER